MRGEDEPSAWDTRFEIPKEMWPERWHLYERSMAIQKDMEFFAEAVYTFYQEHLDKMIRKNPLLWGDFCKKLRKLNPETGNMEESDLLDLAMAPRATEVYADYNTVKPEPEKHFSFSTTLMVLAVELYFESVPDHKLCPYARYSYRTLMEFVESRKELTKESYRHFIEHAYNQFFQHEAFHSSACSKTHAKDLSAGNFKTSTKLKAYTWVTNDGRVARIKKTYATTYRMPDVPAQTVPVQATPMQDDEEEDDVEEIEVENMEVEEVEEEEKDDEQDLVLQVVLEPDAAEILGIPPEDVLREQERQEEEVDYGSSPEGEEPRAELGHSSKEERPDLPYASTPQEKYGNFMVSQLTRKQENLLKHWNLSMGRFVEEDEGIPVPRRLEDINTFQTAMMIDVIAEANHTEFTMSYRALTGVDVSLETFHEMHVVCKHLRDKNAHISIKTFETEDDPQLPVNPRGKDMEYMIPEDKHIILEGDNSKLVDCTVTWLNMMNKDLQDRVLSRLREANKLQLKIEEVNEGEEAEEQESVKKDPVIPPPPRVSTEVQTDPQGSDTQGGSPQGEVPTSSTRSTKVEEVKKEKAQADDTAPKKEVTSTISSTSEITGNESSSVLRNLKDCFTGGYYGEWAGFYNQNFPASQNHRHMFWHLKYRTSTGQHEHQWYEIPEEDLMKEYIKRHKDEDVLSCLTEIRNKTTYSCSDPRMHPRAQKDCQKFTAIAEERHEKDFTELDGYLNDYISTNGCIPYASVLHLLAMRYLGAGLPSPDKFDKDFPYRSSKALSVMFWNLGNWQRVIHGKEPLPANLEKFRPNIRADIDELHKVLDLTKRPGYNNFFTTAVKNLSSHLFLNCEAATLVPVKERLEEAGWTLCFNDWQDLLCAARLGTNGYVKQIAGYNVSKEDTQPRYVSYAIFEVKWGTTRHRSSQEEEPLRRARMEMTRVCVYHVSQYNIGKSQAVCGEAIAHMVWECIHHEVDVIAGDGNKAAYCATPKSPGVPTYEYSLLQFWIDRLVNTATQARRKIDKESAPIRARHFIACSFLDLTFLDKMLSNIDTEHYDDKLCKATTDKGDCCMMTLLEWGHARDFIVEKLDDFDDEDHMNFHGEFGFSVNETCLSCDHEAFLVHERDRDAHNPLLIHFDPHLSNQEGRQYRSVEAKIQNKRRRKDKQRENRRKGYAQQEDTDDEEKEDEEVWINPEYSQQDWQDYYNQQRRQQQAKGRGRGYSAGSSSSSWKPRHRQWR